MAILENFENAWDIDFQLDIHPLVDIYNKQVHDLNIENESKPISELDDMGRDKSNYL